MQLLVCQTTRRYVTEASSLYVNLRVNLRLYRRNATAHGAMEDVCKDDEEPPISM